MFNEQKIKNQIIFLLILVIIIQFFIWFWLWLWMVLQIPSSADFYYQNPAGDAVSHTSELIAFSYLNPPSGDSSGVWRIGIITAYNAEKGQTDNSPTITASGQKVREGIVANNCLAFGSKVGIGDKIYEVQDRKNERYGCEYFDIFMNSKQEAINFGIRTEVVAIVE